MKYLLSDIKNTLKSNDISINTNNDAANPNVVFIQPKAKIEPHVRFAGNHLYSMGSFSYSRSNFIDIEVGRYCSIGRGCKIMGPEHPLNWVSTSPVFYSDSLLTKYNSGSNNKAKKFISPPLKISVGSDVWIGNNCSFKPGIKIGHGSVIAANSIVTKDVPTFSIFAGNPAVFIRYRFEFDVVQEMLDTRWWEYDLKDLLLLSFDDPKKFINEFNHCREKGEINRYKPSFLNVELC
jgi:acetyltransferase-like isoleucine patch superfamily enzyme